MAKATKEKIKEKLHRLKQKVKRKKVYGKPKITGITTPKKPKTHEVDGQRQKDRTAMVGPRGGKYVETRGQRKRYVKKALESALRDFKLQEFFEKFKNKDK